MLSVQKQEPQPLLTIILTHPNHTRILALQIPDRSYYTCRTTRRIQRVQTLSGCTTNMDPAENGMTTPVGLHPVWPNESIPTIQPVEGAHERVLPSRTLSSQARLPADELRSVRVTRGSLPRIPELDILRRIRTSVLARCRAGDFEDLDLPHVSAQVQEELRLPSGTFGQGTVLQSRGIEVMVDTVVRPIAELFFTPGSLTLTAGRMTTSPI